MTPLPNDDEIRSQLAPVRARVLAAGRTESTLLGLPLPGRRRRLLALAVAAVAAAGLTVGAVGVAQVYYDTATTAWCYEAPDLSSRSVQVIDARGAGQSLLVADRYVATSPTEMCAVYWESDEFTAIVAESTARDMPRLVACAQSTRLALVFPARKGLTPEELCGTLGLAAWGSDSGV